MAPTDHPRRDPDRTRATVLIADDHRIFLEGLEQFLQPDYDVIGKATSTESAKMMAESLGPDLIVADYELLHSDGPMAVTSLSVSTSRPKVVMLSLFDDMLHARRAIDLGAAGYVLKQTASEELKNALRETELGNIWISPAISRDAKPADPWGSTAIGAPVCDPVTGPPATKLIEGLSRRQLKIMGAVGRGLSAKDIAAAMGLSRKTVEYHKYKMMRHLGISSTPELIRFVVSNGFDKAH